MYLTCKPNYSHTHTQAGTIAQPDLGLDLDQRQLRAMRGLQWDQVTSLTELSNLERAVQASLQDTVGLKAARAQLQRILQGWGWSRRMCQDTRLLSSSSAGWNCLGATLNLCAGRVELMRSHADQWIDDEQDAGRRTCLRDFVQGSWETLLERNGQTWRALGGPLRSCCHR